MNVRIKTFLVNSLSGFFNGKIIEHTSGICAEGRIKIEEKEATLLIFLDPLFPLHKPVFKLKPANVFGLISHIGKTGEVCYTSDEGLCLDYENPEGIITESFQMVLKTLTDGIKKANSDDLMNEIVACFRYMDGCLEFDGNLFLTDVVKTIKIGTIKNINRTFLGDSADKIEEYCNKYFSLESMANIEYEDAIYIPLLKGTKLPLNFFDSFWSLDELTSIVYENISRSNRRYLDSRLKQKVDPNKSILIVLMVSVPNGNKVLLGVLIEQPKKKGIEVDKMHPLLKLSEYGELKPVVINRHDSEYLMPRGGVVKLRKNKKVAIIGCGSIGGYIAQEIAKSGVLDITLFDNDFLSAENIYRHVLGVNDINFCNKNEMDKHSSIKFPKIFGLKYSIERNLPYTKIHAGNPDLDKIENMIMENKLLLMDFDLVIVALGNITIERFINKHVHSIIGSPPVIFTWVEAHGIGGHAILTNNKGNSGCLECLFSDTTTMNNKAHFAAPNQIFSKDLSGCANLFTPYGSLDSLQSAIIATRLAIDFLRGKENDNPIVSWKGSATEFLGNGYALSDRYSLSIEELENTRLMYKSEICPVCGIKLNGIK